MFDGNFDANPSPPPRRRRQFLHYYRLAHQRGTESVHARHRTGRAPAVNVDFVVAHLCAHARCDFHLNRVTTA
jgi:hypothetical protein